MANGIKFSEISDEWRDRLGTCDRCKVKFVNTDIIKLLSCQHIFHTYCSSWKCSLCNSLSEKKVITTPSESSSVIEDLYKMHFQGFYF